MMALAPTPMALVEPANHTALPGIVWMMIAYQAQAPAPYQGGGGNIALHVQPPFRLERES